MPWGLTRFYGADDLHFITTSCYHRKALLDAARRDLLLVVLERMRLRYRFVVVGYVVMPEHIHLLISEPQIGDPSVVIKAVKLGFVQKLLERFPHPAWNAESQVSPEISSQARDFGRSSVGVYFWQRRFYDFNVWSEEKRIEKLRYIHRNPVVRGLVESPEQWRWSSFRAYAFGEIGPVAVNDCSVLKMRVREREARSA